MIETRHFDYDPFTKIEQIMHYDHDTDAITLERVQHGGKSMIEEIKGRYNAFDTTKGFKGDGMHHIAHIPAMIAGQLQKSGAFDDDAYMRHWLNGEYGRPWRTRPGRV